MRNIEILQDINDKLPKITILISLNLLHRKVHLSSIELSFSVKVLIVFGFITSQLETLIYPLSNLKPDRIGGSWIRSWNKQVLNSFIYYNWICNFLRLIITDSLFSYNAKLLCSLFQSAFRLQCSDFMQKKVN